MTPFYVFDFCGVCDFFAANKGQEVRNTVALQSALFNLQTQIAFKLQAVEYQTEELVEFRKTLVASVLEQINKLDRNNFAVKLQLRYVEKYSDEKVFEALTYEDSLVMAEHIAPLILPIEDEIHALRFDALMHGIELAYLVGKTHNRARNDLKKKVSALSTIANIPQIMVHSELIGKILQTEYLDMAGINDFEHIRKSLRDLMKLIPRHRLRYTTDFSDDILSVEWKDSTLDGDVLKNYKAKAEHYIRQHQENSVISKLKTNRPLTGKDIEDLENILWSELGTKDEYVLAYGQKPLGEFVREIVGLDMNTAKELFAEFLNESKYNSRQIYFVNQIIEYIVHNGMLKDFSVLQETPFIDYGSVVDVFKDTQVWFNIVEVIKQINNNASTLAA